VIERRVAAELAAGIAAYLGPHTARVAVKLYARRAVDRAPEALTPADVGPVLEAMRPMLSTFLGTPNAKAFIDEMTARCSPRSRAI
jgi:hypothetical protein